MYAILSYLPTALLPSKIPFARYVKQHIFDPLGMTSTTLTGTAGLFFSAAQHDSLTQTRWADSKGWRLVTLLRPLPLVPRTLLSLSESSRP